MVRHLVLAGLLALCGLPTAWAQQPLDGLVARLTGASFATRTGGQGDGRLPAGDWQLGPGAAVEARVVIPHDSPDRWRSGSRYRLTLTAYALPGGVTPTLQLFVDGQWRASRPLRGAAPQTLVFDLPVRAGLRTLRVAQAAATAATGALVLRELQVHSLDATAATGAFALQSVSLLSGMFPSNAEQFGTGAACDPERPGCRNIDFIRQLGGNDLTLVSVCEVPDGGSACLPQLADPAEEKALRLAIRHARAQGLTVTLKPFVLRQGRVLNGWVPPDPAAFFDALESNLLRHARIAGDEGVGLLMLGAEMGGRLTSPLPLPGGFEPCGRWQRLIRKLRTVAPALPLTYSPTLAGHWNDIGANEAPYVCFWGELDFIGLNAYAHMNLVPTVPASTQLGSGWRVFQRLFQPVNPNDDDTDDLSIDGSQYLGQWFNFAMPDTAPYRFDEFDLSRADADSYRVRFNTTSYSVKWYADYVIDAINQRFKARLKARHRYPLRAVLTEVGVPSSSHVQGYWGDIDGGRQFEPVYVDEQAAAWDGYLRAFHGDPRIAGISLWGLLPYHDRAVPQAEWPTDWQTSYDVNGKADARGRKVTEERLCRWFKPQPGRPCLTPP
jgi:hypothetical protein